MLSYTRTLDQKIAPPLTIALDATPLSVPTGGVARYTQELARALALRFPEDSYWLLSDQTIPPLGQMPSNLNIGRMPANPLGRRWWTLGLQWEMARVGAGLFHGTDFSVPYLPLKPSVMTLHDLSPWLPSPNSGSGWQPDAGRVRSRTPKLLRLGLATMVITPTLAIRKAAIDWFSLAPDRVVAVPLAAGAQFQHLEASPNPVSRDRPYLLFVGTLEPRKNITRLIEAWREVRRKFEVDLVLAGRTRDDFRAPEPEPGLSVLGPVQESELPSLYSGAVACVYPSLYEGFGLPVLEAMQCGTLVITSTDPAVEEVAGGSAILVEASDSRGLAQAMEAAVQNPEHFSSMREKALTRAKEFSWCRTAELTREVYAATLCGT
jgi:glycosyltransferase involved in cell wall biosynthesis